MPTEEDRTRAVPAADARSWLLVSASRSDRFASAASSAADIVVLDLEDGVIPPRRRDARQRVSRWLSDQGTGWVRINPVGSTDWSLDLATVATLPGLAGVMIAKCESAHDVEKTAAHVPSGVPVIALIESALGIERAFEIASTDRVLRLAFGSGDFRRDVGAADTPTALAYARSRLVVASAAHSIPGPIDGPTLSTGKRLLADDLELSRTLGMTGKLALDASQASEINERLSPSADDIEWAAGVIDRLGANGEHAEVGSDLPQLARAHSLSRLARVFAEQ